MTYDLSEFDRVYMPKKEAKKIIKQYEELQKENEELKSYVEKLGEMANICTKNYTGKVCNNCECGKK